MCWGRWAAEALVTLELQPLQVITCRAYCINDFVFVSELSVALVERQSRHLHVEGTLQRECDGQYHVWLHFGTPTSRFWGECQVHGPCLFVNPTTSNYFVNNFS
jgi:hypothetical protein